MDGQRGKRALLVFAHQPRVPQPQRRGGGVDLVRFHAPNSFRNASPEERVRNALKILGPLVSE